MGFELWIFSFGETKQTGIPRETVRALFPVEKELAADYWQVRYDENSSCNFDVSPLESDRNMLMEFHVDRPCADVRLWEGLLSILQMGTFAMFWPGSPAIVADAFIAPGVREEMVEAIGEPVVVRSAAEILHLLEET